jgi:riboflavin kinase/FMN adenylyltransferase
LQSKFFRFESFQEFYRLFLSKALALSLGMFDGVHLGHKSIIDELINVGTENNLETAILTFWPHPRFVFNPNEDLNF